MSSAGQAVGGLGGAVIGFFGSGGTWAGAYQGFQIGATIGGLLDPPKLPDIIGARLTDTTVQTATYGAIMPRVYGTVAVVGNVFWLENNHYKEVMKKTKSGGKGGQKQTTKTPTYYATFAVGLAIRNAPVVGVRRIWIKNKLFYDTGSSDHNAIRESNNSSKLFTFHDGSNTQAADPRMQATLGVANTSAYRGLCYMVFNDLPLAKYDNALSSAQVKAELVCDGSEFDYQITNAAMMPIGAGLQIWTTVGWNGQIHVAGRNPNGWYADILATSPDGITWTKQDIPGLSSTGGIDFILGTPKGFVYAEAWAIQWMWFSKDGRTWIKSMLPTNAYWSVAWNGEWFMAMPRETTNVAYLSKNGQSWPLATSAFSPYGSFYGGGYGFKGNSKVFMVVRYREVLVYTIKTDVWVTRTLPGTEHSYRLCWCEEKAMWLALGISEIYRSFDDGVTWDLHYSNLGNSFGGTGWLLWTGEVFYTDRFYSYDGLTWIFQNYPSPLALSVYGAVWNGATITVVGSDSYNINNNFTITPHSVSVDRPSIGSVISAECLLSKTLTAGDIDVTGLTKTLRGCKISSVTALRAGIEQLQGAFPFDVVQKGYKIAFIERGAGGSVATIKASELSAFKVST